MGNQSKFEWLLEITAWTFQWLASDDVFLLGNNTKNPLFKKIKLIHITLKKFSNNPVPDNTGQISTFPRDFHRQITSLSSSRKWHRFTHPSVASIIALYAKIKQMWGVGSHPPECAEKRGLIAKPTHLDDPENHPAHSRSLCADSSKP